MLPNPDAPCTVLFSVEVFYAPEGMASLQDCKVACNPLLTTTISSL